VLAADAPAAAAVVDAAATKPCSHAAGSLARTKQLL